MAAVELLRACRTSITFAKAKVAGSNGLIKTLTRSCPNRRGLRAPCVDFGGLRVSAKHSGGLKTRGATPVCRLGEIALITRRSRVQIPPPQPHGRPGFLEGFSRSRAFTFWGISPVTDLSLAKIRSDGWVKHQHPISSAEGCTPRRALVCKLGGQRDGDLVSRSISRVRNRAPSVFAESERMNDRDYAALRT